MNSPKLKDKVCLWYPTYPTMWRQRCVLFAVGRGQVVGWALVHISGMQITRAFY